MEKQLKAYICRERDGDGGCAVVFETNGAAARRAVASALDTEWEGIESCRRCHALDGMEKATQDELNRFCFENLGWWFTCGWNESQIDRDSAPDAVFVGGYVYKSPWAWLNEKEDRAIRKRREAEFKAELEAKYPFATIPYSNAHDRSASIVVEGFNGPINYREDGRATCHQEDVERWHELIGKPMLPQTVEGLARYRQSQAA